MSEILSDQFNENIPKHVAFIMDGNGRWARKRMLPRVEGHRRGANTVRMVVEECRKIGIRYVTLFSFSTENWKRPETEVSALMKLFHYHLINELENLIENGIRLRLVGDIEMLPNSVQEVAKLSETRTIDCNGMDLILAVSYGGRQEILHSVRKIAEQIENGKLKSSELNENVFREFLYAPDVPDPDVLIRTSNEMRISNFLLWQLAYSEIVVSAKHWPEFTKDELINCFNQYSTRIRRFGCTSEQLSHNGIVEKLT
jgi:undecaprenyl diphosphate synthase